jgi:fructose-bisphosphate aldolase class I
MPWRKPARRQCRHHQAAGAAEPSQMKPTVLEATLQALLAPRKGLLAADESFPTIEKHFKEHGIRSSEENRRAYREMLFTTPGLGRFISGAILFDETLRQKTSKGVPMAEALVRQGIVPGIKVDTGTVPLAGSPGEKITQGLDGLRDRLASYRAMGARFSKWRAVITIGPHLPTRRAIEANSWALASFAALSQEAGLVPIVEPEVLMDGRHPLDRCEEVTAIVLKNVFDALFEQRVALEKILLKTGMVLPGTGAHEPANSAQISAATLRCFRRTVPAAVPGVVFLSGGQGSKESTTRLAALCRASPLPWKLSFSFGRALQAPPLKVWRGSPDKVAAAQKALYECARRNSAAVGDQSGENARPRPRS